MAARLRAERLEVGGGGERTGGLAVCFFLVKMLDSRIHKKEDLKRAKQAVKMKKKSRMEVLNVL